MGEFEFCRVANEHLRRHGYPEHMTPEAHGRWAEVLGPPRRIGEPRSDTETARLFAQDFFASPPELRAHILYGDTLQVARRTEADLEHPDWFARHLAGITARFEPYRQEALAIFGLTAPVPEADLVPFLRKVWEFEAHEGDRTSITIARVQGTGGSSRLESMDIWRGFTLDEATVAFEWRGQYPDGFDAFLRKAQTARATQRLWTVNEHAEHIARAVEVTPSDAWHFLLAGRALPVPYVSARIAAADGRDPVIVLTVGSGRVSPEAVLLAYQRAVQTVAGVDGPLPAGLNDLEARRLAYHREQSARGVSKVQQFREMPPDIRGGLGSEAAYRVMVRNLQSKVARGAL